MTAAEVLFEIFDMSDDDFDDNADYRSSPSEADEDVYFALWTTATLVSILHRDFLDDIGNTLLCDALRSDCKYLPKEVVKVKLRKVILFLATMEGQLRCNQWCSPKKRSRWTS